MKPLSHLTCTILILTAQLHPLLAATQAPTPTKSSAFCQAQYYQRAYTQWQGIISGLNPEAAATNTLNTALAPSTLSQISQLLSNAQGNPKQIQLAFDRLTLTNGFNDNLVPQPLLVLIDRLPANQRSQLLPIIDQIATLARSLPSGYNRAQTLALIAAAQAYQRLGQSDRGLPLLQQASRTIVGINRPLLQAEAHWRLAQAQREHGQTTAAQTSVDRAITALGQLKTSDPSYASLLPTKFIDQFLQSQRLDLALNLAQTLRPTEESVRAKVQIATAYLKAKQPQAAQKLFDQTLNQYLSTRTKSDNNHDYIATDSIIRYAQAGGLTSAAQAARKLSATTPHYQARAWLAIAGEARKQNRPKEAGEALKNLIAAGKLGQKTQFGFGFGNQRDYDWSAALYELANTHGYQPEMVQFIQQLNLQSEGAEFLIGEALRAKQFDRAKQLVPIPMPRAIDAGFFEVHNDWLLRVAIAAAEAAQPQQLLDLSQRIQPEFRQNGPLNFSLTDTMQRLVVALHKQGQAAPMKPLVELLQQQALTSLAQPDNLERTLPFVDSIITTLQNTQQETAVKSIEQALITRFKAVPNFSDRFELFQKLLPWSSRSDAQIITLAEALELRDRPEFATWMLNRVSGRNNITAMEIWAIPASPTPLSQVDRFSALGNWWLNQNQPDKAIIWFDRALAAMPQLPPNQDASETSWQSLVDGYLQLNNLPKAQQVVQQIRKPEQRETALRRLNCF